MRERGVVSKIEGRSAEVRFTMSEGCAACNSASDCKVNDRVVETELAPGLEVGVGDFVDVEVPARARNAGIVWLVLAPLALFAAGYSLVPVLVPGAGEGPSALGGMAGFSLGLLGAAFMSRRGAMAGKPVVVGLAALRAHQPDADPDPQA